MRIYYSNIKGSKISRSTGILSSCSIWRRGYSKISLKWLFSKNEALNIVVPYKPCSEFFYYLTRCSWIKKVECNTYSIVFCAGQTYQNSIYVQLLLKCQRRWIQMLYCVMPGTRYELHRITSGYPHLMNPNKKKSITWY